jgi:hypothetical protein
VLTANTTRYIAAAALVLSGAISGVLALAIAAVRILVAQGMAVTPADTALIEDLVAVLPFVVTFAFGALVAAMGVLQGRVWADRLGAGIGLVGATVAAVGLLLIGVGRDPLATNVAAFGPVDGLGILAVVFVIHALAVMAISLAAGGEAASQPAI